MADVSSADTSDSSSRMQVLDSDMIDKLHLLASRQLEHSVLPRGVPHFKAPQRAQ